MATISASFLKSPADSEGALLLRPATADTHLTFHAPAARHAIPAPTSEKPVSEIETFAVIRTRAEFEALEQDWNALFARAGSSAQLFQTFNWCWTWANHYLPKDPGPCPLAIVTVRRKGQLVLIWPLVITRSAGMQQISWMGEPVSQYGDIIVDNTTGSTTGNAELIRRSWTYLTTTLKADVARLAKVRADAALAPFLAEIGARITATEEAPYADLEKAGSIETFLARFNAKTLKNQRRKMRRLEERGALTFDRHSTSTPTVPAHDAVIAGLTLKRAWLRDKGLVSRAFSDQRIEDFFADAITARERPSGVGVSMLRTGGEIADHHIMVDCKDRRALHVLGYNLKFERVGPGNIHLEYAIAKAFDDGIATFDFLAPRHDYKMDWADGVVVVNDHAIGITPRGRAYGAIYLGLIREGLKSAIKMLPKSLTRSIASALRIVRTPTIA